MKEQRYSIGRFVRRRLPGRLDDPRGRASLLLHSRCSSTWPARSPGSARTRYRALTSLLAAILKNGPARKKLPGLEAMMPTSPLAQLVNRRDVVTAADLHLLAADLAVARILSALKALATDSTTSRITDLGVDPEWCCAARRAPPRSGTWIDTDGDVSHFNYFRRPDTASRLTDVLTTTATATFTTCSSRRTRSAASCHEKRDAPVPLPTLVDPEASWEATPRSRTGGCGRTKRPPRAGRLASSRLATARKVTPEALAAPSAELVEHLSASQPQPAVPGPLGRQPPAVESAQALLEILSRGSRRPVLRRRSRYPHPHARLWRVRAAGAPRDADEGRQRQRICANAGARAVMLGHPFGGTVHALLPLVGRGSLPRWPDVGRPRAHGRRSSTSLFAGMDGLLE